MHKNGSSDTFSKQTRGGLIKNTLSTLEARGITINGNSKDQQNKRPAIDENIEISQPRRVYCRVIKPKKKSKFYTGLDLVTINKCVQKLCECSDILSKSECTIKKEFDSLDSANVVQEKCRRIFKQLKTLCEQIKTNILYIETILPEEVNCEWINESDNSNEMVCTDYESKESQLTKDEEKPRSKIRVVAIDKLLDPKIAQCLRQINSTQQNVLSSDDEISAKNPVPVEENCIDQRIVLTNDESNLSSLHNLALFGNPSCPDDNMGLLEPLIVNLTEKSDDEIESHEPIQRYNSKTEKALSKCKKLRIKLKRIPVSVQQAALTGNPPISESDVQLLEPLTINLAEKSDDGTETHTTTLRYNSDTEKALSECKKMRIELKRWRILEMMIEKGQTKLLIPKYSSNKDVNTSCSSFAPPAYNMSTSERSLIPKLNSNFTLRRRRKRNQFVLHSEEATKKCFGCRKDNDQTNYRDCDLIAKRLSDSDIINSEHTYCKKSNNLDLPVIYTISHETHMDVQAKKTSHSEEEKNAFRNTFVEMSQQANSNHYGEEPVLESNVVNVIPNSLGNENLDHTEDMHIYQIVYEYPDIDFIEKEDHSYCRSDQSCKSGGSH